MRTIFQAVAALAVAAAVLVLGACAGNEGGGAPGGGFVDQADGGGGTVAGSCAAAPYRDAGPYGVGIRTVAVAGIPVEIWYPADPHAVKGQQTAGYDMRDWLPPEMAKAIPSTSDTSFSMAAVRDAAASIHGPFPLLLFSHGLGGYRMQSSAIMAHVASWGFVVAAPEHVERGLAVVLGGTAPKDVSVSQLRDAKKRLLALNTTAKDALEGRIDAKSIAVFGHSMGGAAVALVAADDDVAGFATMASGGFSGAPAKPALMLAGAVDGIAKGDVVGKSYAKLKGDKVLVSVANAGHLAFSDICAIGRAEGGVLAIAKKNGVKIPDIVVELATDGCQPEALAPEKGWPVMGHYLVAHFRKLFGINDTPVGLGQAAGACFPGLINSFASKNAQLQRGVDAGSSAPDAGSSTPDAGSSTPDAGSSTPDTGSSTPDTGSSTPDAGPSAPDTGSSTPDSGSTGTTGEKGSVPCGNGTCSLSSSVCCVGLGGASCKAKCGFLEAPQKCDGPEDCGGGQVCCVGFPQGAQCKTTCTSSEQKLCHSNADCSGGTSCMGCQFPGNPNKTFVCTTGC